MAKNKGLYHALIERLGEMVKENVELEQRVHQLTDDYNRVVKQVRKKPADEQQADAETELVKWRVKKGERCPYDTMNKVIVGSLACWQCPAYLSMVDHSKYVICEHAIDADGNDGKNVLEQMRKMRDLCDSLEKEREQLKEQCKQLQIERNEARTSVAEYKHHEADLFRAIERHEESDLVKCGDVCSHQLVLPDKENHILAGSDKCCSCRHNVGKKKYLSAYFICCAYRYDMQQKDNEEKPMKDE